MRPIARAALCALTCTLGLAGCATATGPVQVTRFVETSQQARLGNGTIFVQAMQDGEAIDEDVLVYQSAIARELVSLGYRETARGEATQIAEVRLAQDLTGAPKRNPVSVGVGGSTGSYGSGAGVGIGINLGGSNSEKLSTRLEVRIRDAASGQSLWEGRALFDVASRSILADSAQNASVMADALFREFPGNNGETIAVPISGSTSGQRVSE